MQSGKIDLAIAGYFQDIPEGFYQRELFKSPFVGLCRREHPILSAEISLAGYCQYPHIMASITGDFDGLVDRALPEPYSRNVVFISESFLTLPEIVRETDSLLALPKKLAVQKAKEFDLEIFQLPVEVKQISLKLVWHERVHRDSFQRWMREQICSLYQ